MMLSASRSQKRTWDWRAEGAGWGGRREGEGVEVVGA